MRISTRQGKGPKEEITKPKSPKARWAAAKLMMLPRFQVVSSSALDVPSLYGPRPHLHLTPCPPPSASPSCTLPTLQATREARREAQETEKRLKSSLPDIMRKGSFSDSRAPPPVLPAFRTLTAWTAQNKTRARAQGGYI